MDNNHAAIVRCAGPPVKGSALLAVHTCIAESVCARPWPIAASSTLKSPSMASRPPIWCTQGSGVSARFDPGLLENMGAVSQNALRCILLLQTGGHRACRQAAHQFNQEDAGGAARSATEFLPETSLKPRWGAVGVRPSLVKSRLNGISWTATVAAVAL